CREAGYRLYFQSFGEGGSSSDSVDSLGLPAGCIVVGAVSRHVLDRLRDAGTPYVLVDLLMSEGPASQLSVRIDYAAGTRAAMDHLYQLGHRRIGFIGFPGSERYRAYWQT